MPSASETVIWLEYTFFCVYVFFLGFRLGLIRRFRFLHLYLFCIVCVSLADGLVLRVFGLTSSAYFHCYLYLDLLLSLALYLVIVELYRLKLSRNVWRRCWPISVAIPVLLIPPSVVAARESGTHGFIHFSIALSEYAFFASLALTFVLWGISRVTFRDGGIAARMIHAWAIYFLLFGLVYGVRHLSLPYSYSYSNMAMAVARVYAAWLPVALGYAMVNGLEFGV
jgi:hypothetical protein